MAERRGGVWKNTFLKMVEIVFPTSRYEVDEIVDQTNFAVNIFPRMNEYSPPSICFWERAWDPRKFGAER
jgi:hypothetical protein